MPSAFFVVRATVTDPAKRKAFDTWYQKEHLPDATRSWGVLWSTTDPSLHQATYEFADEASLDRAMKGEDLKRLVADFNRDWPDVTRTREMRTANMPPMECATMSNCATCRRSSSATVLRARLSKCNSPVGFEDLPKPIWSGTTTRKPASASVLITGAQ